MLPSICVTVGPCGEKQELRKKLRRLLWLKFCVANAKANGSLLRYPDSSVPPGSASSFKTSALGTFSPCQGNGRPGRGATAGFNRNLITSPFTAAFRKETRIPTGRSFSTNNNRRGEKEKVTDSNKQSVLLEDHYSDIIYFRLFDTLQCLTSQAHLVPFKSKAALQFARRKCDKHYQGGKEKTRRL